MVNVANIIDASLACSSGVVFKCMIDHATYLIPGCLFAVPIELLFTTTYLQHGIEIFSDTLIGGSTLLETVCCSTERSLIKVVDVKRKTKLFNEN